MGEMDCGERGAVNVALDWTLGVGSSPGVRAQSYSDKRLKTSGKSLDPRDSGLS